MKDQLIGHSPISVSSLLNQKHIISLNKLSIQRVAFKKLLKSDRTIQHIYFLNQKSIFNMETIKRQQTEADKQIRRLLLGIHNTTIQMSNTFEQAILRHEQQFIKTYRTKISELTTLFEDLTRVIQDKFMNNALTNRLDIVTKQRDYFKYECLKLNVQYQTLQNQQNSLNGQITNVIEQMNIYKHLLQSQKLKNKSLQHNVDKIKNDFTNMAYKSLTETTEALKRGSLNKQQDEIQNSKETQKTKKKLQKISLQLKQKSEQNRNFKIRISELQNKIIGESQKIQQNKEMYEIFKDCVAVWKRQIITKDRMMTRCNSRKKFNSTSTNYTWTLQKVSNTNKKQLLKFLFSTDEFLEFIEKLLFSKDIQVGFTQNKSSAQDYMKLNRKKLYEFMRKKKLINSPVFDQMY